MESDSHTEGLHEETLQKDFKLEMINCPNCHEKVPKSLYCLKCGFPLYNMSGQADEVTIEIDQDPFELETTDVIAEDAIEELVPVEKSTHKIVFIDDEYTAENETTSKVSAEDSEQEWQIPEEEKAVEEPLFEENKEHETELEKLEEEETVFEGRTGEIFPKPLYQTKELETVQEVSIGSVSPEREEVEVKQDSKLGDAVTELTKDLIKAISLKLWSIDLLIEGRVKEDHFNKLFEGYLKRSEECVKRRDEMLKRVGDMQAIERMLDEAKVGLGELEVRKAIGDLREGEYEAKAPAFQWDIRHYEEELSKRREKVELLSDLTRTVPGEKIVEMKEKARGAEAALDGLERSDSIGPETVARIRSALSETLDFLKDFGSDQL